MALIENGKHDMIIKNIDSALNTALNVEGAGPQGVFRLRQTALEVAGLLKIREFVEGEKPKTKVTTLKKGGK